MSLLIKRLLFFLSAIIIFIGVVFGGLFVYANSYTDRVLPGIVVEYIPVGGMTREEVKNYFEALNKKISHEPIKLSVEVDGKKNQILIDPTVGDHSLVQLDSEKIADYLVSFGKHGNAFLRVWQVINSSVEMGLSTDLAVIDEEELLGKIKKELSLFETKTQDATVSITSIEPYVFTVGPAVIGLEFDYPMIVGDIKKSWYSLRAPALTAAPKVTAPDISEDEARQVAELGKPLFEQGGITVIYHDEYSKRDLTWKATATEIAKWVLPQKIAVNKLLVLGVKKEAVKQYLKTTVEPTVHREPRNAEFAMQDGKISKFIGSQTGVTVQFDMMYEAINQQITSRFLGNVTTSSIPLEIAYVEPDITTGEVNDLGIEDVLGVGYSSYKGSPTNRIKNIRFAVTKKLNGILIKPGETFSMLNALKPFTEEAGYLPELVIKGDRIKPEVGGGLCQVGSTMFRAAMNSGLDIVERRNHSLVVNYYNDHRNKMPGADATIYDPAPDFKFKNDTAGNILIMTEMNEKTQELFFTLWGKSDGRKGFYDPPTLISWIATGPAKEIITDELPEGKKKCQEPHPGAVASLKYHIDIPGGERITRIFESHYRPLPRICLVGGTPVTSAPTDGQIPTSDSNAAIFPAPGPADTAIPVE